MSDSTSDSDVSSLNWISSLCIPLTVPWSPWFPELNGSVKHLRPCRLVWCWNGIMAFGEPQICKAFRGLEKTAVSFFSMDSSKTGMETVIGPLSPEPWVRAPKNIVTPSWAELNPKKPAREFNVCAKCIPIDSIYRNISIYRMSGGISKKGSALTMYEWGWYDWQGSHKEWPLCGLSMDPSLLQPLLRWNFGEPRAVHYAASEGVASHLAVSLKTTWRASLNWTVGFGHPLWIPLSRGYRLSPFESHSPWQPYNTSFFHLGKWPFDPPNTCFRTRFFPMFLRQTTVLLPSPNPASSMTTSRGRTGVDSSARSRGRHLNCQQRWVRTRTRLSYTRTLRFRGALSGSRTAGRVG